MTAFVGVCEAPDAPLEGRLSIFGGFVKNEEVSTDCCSYSLRKRDKQKAEKQCVQRYRLMHALFFHR